MANIIRRMGADLYADSSGFESGLKRADRAMQQSRANWNNALNQAGRSFQGFNTHVERTVTGIVDLKQQAGGIATAFAGALSVQKIAQYSDTWKNISARMNLATGSLERTRLVQDQLFKVAQNTATPLENNIDAYTRLNQALTPTLKSQTDLVRVTDLMSKTLAISGTNAAGAATFFTQFGQAAQSDFKAVGQELQTFADQNPRFLKAIQSLTDGTGKSLKQMAADGELSTEKLIKALLKAGDEIDKEAANLGLTIGKSLTMLDNAFLKYIGRSDAVASGTSSIALAIKELADNLETIANLIGVVAAVFATRLISALIATSAAWVLNTRQVLLYQAALARMAGVSATAAAGQLALAGASGAAARAMAFLGGPVGLIVTVMGAAVLATSQFIEENKLAEQAQDSFAASTQKVNDLTNDYVTATDQRREAIKQETRDLIANLDLQLQAWAEAATKFNEMSRFERGLGRIAGKLGWGPDVDSLQGSMQGIANVKAQAEALLNGGYDSAAKAAADYDKNRRGSGSSGKAKKDVYADIVKGLERENAQTRISIDLYGEKDAAIQRAQKALQIENQLIDANVKLTPKQREELEAYLDTQERQADQLNDLEEQHKRLQKAEEQRQQALQDLGASFESACESAIVEGNKLSDVLNGLLQDILKLAIRSQITQPLANFVTGAGGGGGLFNFLGNLLPSFDVGTDYVPNDMIAKIHKGERILTAAENKAFSSGLSGGAGAIINLNVVNNSSAKVTTSQKDSGGMTDISIMIDDLVSQKMGQPGSKIDQAMNARSNRAIVRR